MAITRAIDPITDNEIVIISGVIDRIIIKEAEKTSKNLEYGVTHLASLLIDGIYINYISIGTKEGRDPNIAINQGTKDSPKWVQIQETDEVKVVVTEKVVGDKTYYSAKRTAIKLVKKNATPGQAPQQNNGGGSGSSYTAKPKDNTGLSTGHSLNGAMNYILTFGLDNSNDFIIETAKKVHNVTERVKLEYAKANPEMSAYDTGAAAGNSILNACKLVGTEADFEEGVYALATDFLNNVVPKIMEHVKGGTKEEAPPAKITRATPAKKAATKAPAVAKKEPVMPPLADSGDFTDMEEDLPFADPMKRSGVHLVM